MPWQNKSDKASDDEASKDEACDAGASGRDASGGDASGREAGAGADEEADFKGLRVLSLESRRAEEMVRLIERFGGVATVVPSMREVALPHNPHLPLFENALFSGALDITIWMTGDGTRMMLDQSAARFSRDDLARAIKRTVVVARGPKPVGALREIGVAASIVVPYPNTWREVLAVFERRRNPRARNALDAPNDVRHASNDVPNASNGTHGAPNEVRDVTHAVSLASLVPLVEKRVALQEYGVPNRALARELTLRGATVLRVPVYRWSLPEDVGPLARAIGDIIENRFDIALFTTATQVWHLFKLAYKKGMEDEMREGLGRIVLASVGPTTSEALREFDLPVDLEPEHPQMGHLVEESAARAHALLRLKRAARLT